MTLLDLGLLIRRYLAIVIIVPVVCAALCLGAMIFSAHGVTSLSTATSRIIVNSQVQPVAGLASSEARVAQLENEDISATARADAATMTVVITVTGENEEDCIKYANLIADNAMKTANDFYADTASSETLLPFKAQVEYANSDGVTVAEAGKSLIKYGLIALLAGLVLAIVIVVLIDMVRRPVKSLESLQADVELPVLEKLPSDDGGKRLLANVRFSVKQDVLRTVCVVPISEASSGQQVADMLKSAALEEDTQLQVQLCESFDHGVSAAYEAKKSDATVIAVKQWSDSITALERSVAELKLADVCFAGVAFVEER